jgi:hypothetical protein
MMKTRSLFLASFAVVFMSLPLLAQTKIEDTVTSGGLVDVNAEGSSGVFAKAKTSTKPNISAVLGAFSAPPASPSKFSIFASTMAPLLTVTGQGRTGIGTDSPTTLLHLKGDALPLFVLESTTEARFQIKVGNRDKFLFTFEQFGAGPTGQAVIGAQEFDTLHLVTNATPRITIDGGGNVLIGQPSAPKLVTVNGDISVSGNINAKFQDIAEWVPAKHDLAPGTVVVLSGERPNEVVASARPYDTRVAGVVSAKPGLVLGEAVANHEQIATMGRVKVRVDATKAPVHIGDLLVTSGKPGTAMRSEPLEIGGRLFHQPGTLIGKALEPLPSGEGEILVLLSLQ